MFRKNWLLFLSAFVICYIAFSTIVQKRNPHVDASYTQLVQSAEANNILTMKIHGDRQSVSYTTRDNRGTTFEVVSPVELSDLTQKVIKNGAIVESEVASQSPGLLLTIMISILPVLILVFFMYRISKKQGVSDFTQNRAKLISPDSNSVRLSDVISNPGEHDEVTDIIGYLKHPDSYKRAKATFPRGILLSGPPGVGKTLVAKAVAGEAGVPFYSVAGSEFVELYVGVGASRVRSMFETLRKLAPCILFIDEIDALARSREGATTGGNREADQTLMQLLVEMDGVEDNSGIIILAATNRVDTLDSAILRPGRFDKVISINLPDVVAREKIIKLNLSRKNVASDANAAMLAKGTPGFSGADLENLVNEASLIIAKEDRTIITMRDLESSKDKIMMGNKSPKKMNKEELELTAFHESGHVIVGYSVPAHDPVYKVSIIPRGNALGVTMFVPEEDQYSLTREQLNSKIATLLAGRAAEELIYGENKVTTGASNDLQRATAYARNMVTKWGFSTEVGLAQYSANKYRNESYSESMSNTIDKEVERILQENYKVAKDLLKEHSAKLRKMATALLEHETLSQEDILVIMNDTLGGE